MHPPHGTTRGRLGGLYRSSDQRHAAPFELCSRMNSPADSSERAPRDQNITVPRDPDVDTTESSRRNVTPSPDNVNIKDEDYVSAAKPLSSDSPEVGILHSRTKEADDQLEVDSAGDAARPTKTGIMNPALPPRSEMK
jgi:hypothetical protein